MTAGRADSATGVDPEAATRAASLVITNGEVLDPAAGLRGQLDIAITGGRITAVGPDLAALRPDRVLDVRGALVLPGLVDIHTHCYWGGSYIGMRPEPLASRSGVTTWVDAGSAGAWNLGAFHELVDLRCEVTVRGFINISAIGLAPRVGELDNLEFCDVRAAVDTARDHGGFVVGVKVRMGHADHADRPLLLALEAATELGLPVMMHIRSGPPDIGVLLDHLRPGDILTHCYTGQPLRLVGDSGEIVPQAFTARDRGVLFDVAHGGTAFAWRSAERMLAAGLEPDLLSSDIHTYNLTTPNIDLPTTMSKLLHLGLPLDAVVRSVTSTPADVIGLGGEVGTLAAGARADLAVFRLSKGATELWDAEGERRVVDRTFQHVQTVLGGRLMDLLLPEAPPAYDRPGEDRIAFVQQMIDRQAESDS